MIVKVSEIPDGGLNVEFSAGAELFGADQEGQGGAEPHGSRGMGTELRPAHGHEDEPYPGVRLIGDASARFHISVAGSVILLDGEVEAEFGLECSRCGRKFELPVSETVSVDLATPDMFGDEADVELHPDDLDVGMYDGEKIDLSAILREQLLLQLPIKPLCSEDCKGLCQHCGKDLNKGECECSEPTGHVGLSGLKELLDKMKEGEQKDGKPD